MPLLTARDRRAARAIAHLTTANPFSERRVELEREALKKQFVGPAVAWSFDPLAKEVRPNVAALDRRAEDLLAKMKAALATGARFVDDEARLFDDLALHLAFGRYEDAFFRVLTEGAPVDFFDAFETTLRDDRAAPGVAPYERAEVTHLFSLFFQLRRAFHFTYRRILGASAPAARLREEVWQSIFTHDLDRYRAVLYDRMQDVPTLVVGPSGTGKELVANAIGRSRFIPYSREKGRFEADYDQIFLALNLAALSPTLIESELFGHRRGAFTGAIADREGYLERPAPYTTVFLDEIGEVDPAVQVKLLRVLQTRNFLRLGDGAERTFGGKIVAATHRDLAERIADGAFREDFFYRLCADRIETPTLAEQLADDPDELARVVLAVAYRVAGPQIAESLADETVATIGRDLGPAYAWPGNMRELEQCVRSVLVRRSYRPSVASPDDGLFADALRGTLTAEELLVRYCTLVYVQTGSYEAAARRLLMDRRTVKRKVDAEWAERLREEIHP